MDRGEDIPLYYFFEQRRTDKGVVMVEVLEVV